MEQSYDLLVIGSGPGGHAAAVTASRRGLKVALIERGPVGGVCLNVGCIPTKALVAVAQAMRAIRRAAAMGIRVSPPELDYPTVLARNQRIITTLRQGLLSLLRHHRVELIAGEARLDDAHTVQVLQEGGVRAVRADRLIVATGASPHPGPWQFDGARVLSYRELLSRPALPASILIIGGGVIGCEFASYLSHFNVTVTIVEQQAQILPGEDPEAVRVLARALQQRGVAIHAGQTVERLQSAATGVSARLVDGTLIEAECALIAIGQQPNSTLLGLEPLGIRTQGGIEVQPSMVTRQPHLAAVGDCVAGHGLAHWASAEGVCAVENLLSQTSRTIGRHEVPRCIFTDPEIAQIGALESESETSAVVSRFSFGAMGKSLCDDEPEGFVKLLVDPATDRVRGATIVGAHASSLIHLAVLAIQAGMSVRQLARAITAHPTLPEAVTEAAAQVYGEALYSVVKARPARAPDR